MLRQLITTVLLTAMISPAWAGYKLDPDHSELHFVSVKKTDFAEVHRFKALSGSMSENGKVTLNIDLDSVATGIDIRDERLKNLLFQTDRYKTATVTTHIDPKMITALAVGERKTFDVDGKLDLHGKQHDIKAAMTLVRLSNNKLFATTTAPVIVKASEFDLGTGLNQLAQIAALSSISDAVVVTLTLEFDAD